MGRKEKRNESFVWSYSRESNKTGPLECKRVWKWRKCLKNYLRGNEESCREWELNLPTKMRLGKTKGTRLKREQSSSSFSNFCKEVKAK